LANDTAVAPPTNGASVSLLADAPVYLMPDSSRTPLRVLPKGASLTFLEAAGVWYHVTFRDPQWGTRYGYVDGRLVAATSTPVDVSIPGLAPAQEPVDMSVPTRRTAAQTPVDSSVPKSRAPNAGTSNLEPMDLSVRPKNK
jgi:hypothetical protein